MPGNALLRFPRAGIREILSRLNSDWIGPRDVEVGQIGELKSKLAKIDAFANRRRHGVSVRTSLKRMLNSLISRRGGQIP